ncbi:helix-turn-helix domain-containing protein [Streptomyces sp. NPDC087425]|uniref:nSTAND1 domain-containing NTPase n=1 Tax=Streptomyces sp. NPDC087425 TaxID=3365787 RepID=UPI00382437C0
MGRPERPIDPEAGPVQRLACELRALRRSAGSPSYRAMSQLADVSVTALSQAAAGERLPSAAVVRAYARACGAEPDDWERRLKAVAEEAAPYRGADSESPYRGTEPFQPGDRDLFFGRDRAAEDAMRLVREHRFAVLLGATGSGTSSLVRAGLIPRLEDLVRELDCGARLRLITPGARPATTHGALLAPPRTGPERIVVVDQFDEIFTKCRDRADRWLFVDQLLAAREPGSRLRVILAAGSRFADRCAEHPGLAEALRSSTLRIEPPTRTELREVIVGPATAAGLRIERELTARLIEETVDEPGALPLLSQTLRETWRRRRSGVLTTAAYEEAGGVRGTVVAAAEEVYAQFDPAQAQAARRLLLALITPGDGTLDTRRPLPRADLREWPDPEIPLVLERLARARLVTVDDTHVEVAHSVLITGWPRLRGWREENCERMRQHRRLAEAARVWEAHGHATCTLYRGARLATADALFGRDRHDDDLSGLQRGFLSASRVAASMEHWRADRAKERHRTLLLALSFVVLGALAVGQIAWDANDTAERERDRTGAHRAAVLAAQERFTDPRRSALLSVAAWRLDPELPDSRAALFDSLAGPERDVFSHPPQRAGARAFLVDSGRTLLDVGGGTWSSWDVRSHRRLGSGRLPDAPVTAVAPDGRTVALTDTTGTRLWRLPGAGRDGGAGFARSTAGPVLGFGADGRSYAVRASTSQLRSVADGRVLFESAAGGTVVPSADGRLVAVCPPGRPLGVRTTGRPLGDDPERGRVVHGGWESTDCAPSGTVLFSPDGRRLAATTPTGIRVWDTRSGHRLADLTHPGDRHLAFTPDGAFLAAAGQDGVTVWRVPGSEVPSVPVFRHTVADGPVTALAFNSGRPSLRYLAGNTVHTLDLTTPLTSPWLGRAAAHVVLSPDGGLVAVAQLSGNGYEFALRATADGRLVARLPAPDVAPGGRPLMAFSPDGQHVAYGTGAPAGRSTGARFDVWDLPAHRRSAALAPTGTAAYAVRAIALTPGGEGLLLCWTTADGSVAEELWDTAIGTRVEVPEAGAGIQDAVSVAGFRGPTGLVPYDLEPNRPEDTQVVAFSRDGSHLATGGAFGSVDVWDGMSTRHRAAVIPPTAATPGCTACSEVTALGFSPDGLTLAVGYGSGALRLWDVGAQQPLGDSLSTPGDAIRSVAFSNDGASLYAGSGHVPIQHYGIAPAGIVDRLCARAGGDLTRAEWRTYLPDVPYRRLCP